MAEVFSIPKYMVEVIEQFLNGEIDQRDFDLTLDAIAETQRLEETAKA